MTVVEGMNDKNIDLKELLKTLKMDCACGGTAKGNRMELQGDHKEKVKKMLMKIGFSDDLIELR
jgi:translation initiation factor 1